jgi:hypothetical protein
MFDGASSYPVTSAASSFTRLGTVLCVINSAGHGMRQGLVRDRQHALWTIGQVKELKERAER